MVGDDVGLFWGQKQICLGIFQGPFGMMKAMEPVRLVRCVPIIEKVIVEQSTPQQTCLFAGNAQKTHQSQAKVGYCHAVEQHRGIAVLYKLPALGQPGAMEQRR